ncbi:MAG: patatin-like phospholipase family protein [Calditrichia bacterium]
MMRTETEREGFSNFIKATSLGLSWLLIILFNGVVFFDSARAVSSEAAQPNQEKSTSSNQNNSLQNFAENLPPEAKIGLVLSGGGARGFAHVGVLNVLDSLGIPVDYLAGTSIGAIVGGLYSAGYSAQEIDSLARNMDWVNLFSDTPPRNKLSMLEKQESGRFQITFKIKNNTLEPPSGLLFGQKIDLLLSRLTLPYAGITSFDSLQIPYRALAVDLISGNEVVLDHGSLSRAIRASMAVPSVFTPVEWGDSLLVDGGILNNAPVKVVKNMGADFIIVVDVATPKKSKEELNSAFSILLQAFLLAGYNRQEENMKFADLIISPDLENFSTTDFNSGDVREMVRRGETAAREKMESLVPLQKFKMTDSLHHKVKKFDGGIIESIKISGNQRLSYPFIHQNLGLKAGDSLKVEILEEKITQLYSLGYFELITYQLEKAGPERYRVILHVTEKPEKLLRLGARYQDNRKTILGASLQINDFPFPGMRNEVSYLFSGLQLFNWEISYPRRMLGSRLFPYLRGFYQDIPLDVYRNHERVARYHQRSAAVSLGAGGILKNWGILKLDYNIERLFWSPSIAFTEEGDWPDWKYYVHYARLSGELDFLDNTFSPRSGYATYIWYERTLDFIKQHAQYDRFFWENHYYFSPLPYMTAGLHQFFAAGRDLPVYRNFFLGGPASFVGMNYDEFAAPNLLSIGLDFRFKINDTFSLLALSDAGRRWQKFSHVKIPDSAVIGIGAGIQANTLAGPFRFVIGLSEGETHQYFTFGFNLSSQIRHLE